MANPLKMLKLKPTHFQFIQELPIDAPPKRVWASLLDIANWFGFDGSGAPAGVKRKLDARVGGHFVAEFPDGTVSLYTTITHMEPGKLLRMAGPMGMSHVPTNNVFIFELQPRGKNGTLLRFCQRTFGYLTPGVGKDYQGGWNQLLPKIKALAEGGGRKSPARQRRTRAHR